MKNRIVSISLAVILALSVALIGCGGEGVPEVTEYNLAISSTEGGSVTTPGEGIFPYEDGTDVSLEAVAEEGYVFDEWTGDVDGIADVQDATTTITMNADYIVIANFKEVPEQPTKLVIGMARDTDEGLAFFEMLFAGPVIREFVEQVNLSGGVHLSAYDTATWDCYVPLEIDRREVNVATWDVEDVTAEICADIIDGSVHFLFGGPGPDFDCTMAQAPIANEAEVVLLSIEGGMASIATDPLRLAEWSYVFFTLSHSDWYQIPVLQDMLETELGRAPRAYITYIGESGSWHGVEYKTETINQFGAANVVDGGFHSYWLPDHPGEPEAIIAAAKAAYDAKPYDVFCAYTFPWNVSALTIALMGNNFNPPAILFGPGANTGDYGGVYFDQIVEGIMGFTSAAYDTNPEIQAVYDLIAERMDDDKGDLLAGIPGVPGILTLDYWGMPLYWAGMEMWLEAVERVGYVDQEKLRDALAGLEGDPADTILGECWFRMYGANGEGGGNLDYLCHTGEIGQWQSGEYETVGYDGITDELPNYVVTADFMFPMTDKWIWLQD